MYCFFCCSDEILVTLKMTVQGQKQDISLCPLCAAERGISRQGEGFLMDYDELNRCLDDFSREQDRRVCPGCGTSRESVLKRGVTGCSECYTFFRDDLLSLLQGETEVKKNQRMQIDSLKKELEGLLKTEDYEGAAELRDKIDRLKEKLKNTPS